MGFKQELAYVFPSERGPKADPYLDRTPIGFVVVKSDFYVMLHLTVLGLRACSMMVSVGPAALHLRASRPW